MMQCACTLHIIMHDDSNIHPYIHASRDCQRQLLTLFQVMEHLPSWRPYGSRTLYLPSGSITRVIAPA